MKQQRLLFSKYYCDNKLGIYSAQQQPMNNKQYKKMISNAKSKYMNDYISSRKIPRYIQEKKFNNILSNYYEDFNKLKNKYNFSEEQDSEKDEAEVSEEDYIIKRQNIDRIFSTDVFDMKELNFDVTDNLINEFPKENNYSLIKNTQIKEDYDSRIQGFLKNKKYLMPNDEKITDEEMENFNENEENNYNDENINLNAKNEINEINNKNNRNEENNLSENNNNTNKNNEINTIEEKAHIGYIEDDSQFNLKNNENYLKLNQPSLNQEKDLPLFLDIISCNNNINYQTPFYEKGGTQEEETNLIKKSIDEDQNKKIDEEEEKYSDFENDNNNNNVDKDNVNYEYNSHNNFNEINNEINNENKLVLENTNEENNKLEDIINSNFKGDYKIPEYKIPSDMKKCIKAYENKNNEIGKYSVFNNNINIDKIQYTAKNNYKDNSNPQNVYNTPNNAIIGNNSINKPILNII